MRADRQRHQLQASCRSCGMGLRLSTVGCLLLRVLLFFLICYWVGSAALTRVKFRRMDVLCTTRDSLLAPLGSVLDPRSGPQGTWDSQIARAEWCGATLWRLVLDWSSDGARRRAYLASNTKPY